MIDPIIVTGCGRSGASMIAGVLQICGAFSGNVGGVNGTYENLKVKSKITEYFESIGVDPACQYPLPSMSRLPIPNDWAKQIIDIMQSDGYTGGPWFVKNSRIIMMWPIWHYAFPRAKWLIVRRRKGDIVSSCMKTDFMKAFKNNENIERVHAKNEREAWQWWVRQYELRFIDLITEGVNQQMIWPAKMVYGDYQQLFEVVDWLGLQWKTKAFNFIDPKFYKIRKQEGAK